ncbi:sensor histidine kinase [Sphingomonas lenta]|uniref:histidine kinase n=1 Tax=Sphingomonas lenta TaxID=1141887 RepID=A0A2A2SGD1_9SPHN|nr:ATP-binding protein [Sphingomonas lenta]PAX08278.1 ATP-binding protein [Sphingomonas lenta]
MGFRLALLAWVGALGATLWAFTWTLGQPGLGAARVVAAIAVAGVAWALLRHVRRTNTTLARFVEALRHGDFATRFDGRGGAGFDDLGRALDSAMRDLQTQRRRGAEELRFLEALVDDLPVAVLTVEEQRGVSPVNKVARRLFDRHEGVRPADFATYGETFARRLAEPGATSRELLLLNVGGGVQRAIVRAATLERLGAPVRVVTVEPVQSTLDAVEVEAQTDLVRVLTHEILNSLTPVTSLAGTAAVLLGEEEPDIAEARLAVATLARRAEGLRRFIDSYRAVARPPEPRRRRFAAEPFAAELARLFGVEWLDHRLDVEVEPGLVLDADPDLLAQALINLLRNAAQASAPPAGGGRVRLSIRDAAIEVEDDGPGVPDEIRGDVFLPFFTTRPQGTGVGLNLVRQTVVGHGWRIEIATGALGGALFRIGVTD